MMTQPATDRDDASSSSAQSTETNEVVDNSKTGDRLGGQVKKPVKLEDLTPAQQDRYKRLLMEREKVKLGPKGEAGAPAHAASLRSNIVQSEAVSTSEGKNKGKEKQRETKLAAGGGRQGIMGLMDGAAPKRFEDLSDEDKARHFRARAKRKEEEKRKLKIGQTSGLSAEEKTALSSPDVG